MPDPLIRSLDAETVRRIDTAAERQGLSRNEYLRREVSRRTRDNPRPATRADLARSVNTLEDLADEDVMRQAWM